ncbi:F-box/FBD/LRR-repeat protein At4g26340-like isoform X1 [Apium graveolens]|uniref:F-box/FBD/LRR-repeat protein At4g26340-like isoform X1 n=2 Tax=Apium graveolens TaxID=4045 RepID=UPI003D78C20E
MVVMDFGLHNSITKRQRFLGDISGFNEDRISNLPDGVLSLVLSFLPTKSAVGTTILSKRWNYLWTSVKNLDFDSSSVVYRSSYVSYDEFLNSFVKFVERVLFFHDGRSVDKFCLSSSSGVCAIQFYTWVSAVVPCHLKELEVNSPRIRHTDMLSTKFWQVDMPWSLFTCKTLTTLKLSGGSVLNLPTRVCLPVLKILHLSSVIYVDDASIQKLISGCPVLEDLDIERHEWDGVRVINITSPTLKRFSMQFFLYGYIERCSYKISVSAPSLVYLKLADNMAVEYSLYDMPSLVEAQIGIYNDDSSRSLELLEEVTHVRVLQLSGKILEFIESDEDYEIPMFHNVARLELGANKQAGWDLLAELLESTPNLEVLVFPRGLVKRRSGKKPYFEFGWYTPESVPGCLVFSLETIIIHEFFGKKCEMDLVEYLLANAKVLKKMTIHFLYFKQQESCQRKLMHCRRGSPACNLELILKDGF